MKLEQRMLETEIGKILKVMNKVTCNLFFEL